MDLYNTLNGLDLFSGIGGLTVALEPWVTPVAYCENDRHAQAVLLSRQSSGCLPFAPLWDDVCTLNKATLGGMPIDIIYGGFPCQDISVAGLGAGLAGKRSGLFFEIIRLVAEIRPAFVFLENVPAITSRGLGEVTAAFTKVRYDCRWGMLSAYDVGAPHRRERWFLLAHSERERGRRNTLKEQTGRDEIVFCGSNVAHACGGRLHESRKGEIQQPRGAETKCGGKDLGDTDRAGLEGNGASGLQARQSATQCASWWSTEPDVGGTLDGLSRGMDGTGGVGDAEETENWAKAFLRVLSESPGAQTLWDATRGLDCVSAENVLLAFVREYENDGRAAWAILEGEETPEKCLRALQKQKSTRRAPLRRGPLEQFFGEYPDAMRELSRVVASRSKTPWAHPLWESGVARVGGAIPFRVDRIRGLGNAVVPLQAREAFKRLMGL